MPGYKMKNGSKNYMVKSYKDGGLVETKKYEDGKLVITPEERANLSMKAMQNFLNEDTSKEEVTVIIKDSKKNPNKYTDMMGVPIKKPESK